MFTRVKLSTMAWLLLLSIANFSFAQPPTDSVDPTQKAAAEKFLQLFLARPQTGTALDKTVEYYQSIGELDALSQRIKQQATEQQNAQPESAARHWLAAALVAQSQSRWLESIELLQQAPSSSQHAWPIGNAMAVAYEQLQLWPATIEVLQPLIDQVLDNPDQGNSESVIEAARRLAKAYSRAGKSDEAIKIWQKLETRFARDIQIAVRLASMAADEGELEFAGQVLERILAGKLPATKRIELAIQRTSLLARAGHEEKAIANYQQLLNELNADSWLAADIMQRIEDIIVGRDGIESLLNYYRSQLDKRPDDVNVMLCLAAKLDSEKQWDESGKLFLKLIERTSTALAPRLAYAQSLVHQERWRDASIEFAKLAQLQPRNEDVLMQWCEAISRDESLDASQRDAQVRSILEKRLEGTTPTAEAWQQLASRLQRFGQTERAAFWLVKAHQLQPNDLSVLSDYCRTLLDLGREPEVLQAASTFEAANRSNREVLTQLADLYGDLGFDELGINCLSRACQLGPTSTMRFRLSELFEKAQRQSEAAEQLELAWTEIASQTKSPSEQETLCEDVVRRQIELAIRMGKLQETLTKLKVARTANSAQPALAGLDADSLSVWRLTKFQLANSNGESNNEKVIAALKGHPNSTMLWRLRAELDEQAKRLPDAVEAHRKLAELDARRRSEHLLEVARGLARLGRIEAALQQAEAITTETASSQHVIEVFNLALENNAERFAMNLLNRRLQARPGDVEVLQRLIKYHLENSSYLQAADYQWQNLQLMRTPDQRQAAVELLIETHAQLRTLGQLEQQLEKFWRQHDMWREFGVWQAMIALKGEYYERAEKLLARLAQSQTTRRFAIENLLRLAERQSQNLKRFGLMKQLAAIDAQAVSTDDIAKVLIDMPEEHRSRTLVDDALALVRGPSKRLALIQDLIQAGSVDMALRLIEGMPEPERNSWPIIVRAALAWASLPVDKDNVPAHVQSAAVQLQRFTEQPLELPENFVGQRLLEELLDSQTFISELLVTTTYLSARSAGRASISQIATNCQSSLQAYQAVVAAQLQVAATPAERRELLASHRHLAMQQPSPRQRAARLAALALVTHWHSKVPTFQRADESALARITPGLTANAAGRDAVIRKRLGEILAAKLPLVDAPLVSRLSVFSEAFQFVIVELQEVADQQDPLAALLCLWETAQWQRDLLKPINEPLLKRAAQWSGILGPYASFAPAQIVTVIALLQAKDHPEQASETMQTLSRLSIEGDELQRVLQAIMATNDPRLLESLIASQVGRVSFRKLLGEMLGSRNIEMGVQPAEFWRVIDYAWQSEIKQGLRTQTKLQPPSESSDLSWTNSLPMCSVAMHESSMFDRLDFSVVRAIVARAQSTNNRQELLKLIKQLDEQDADSDLRLVRQLAHIFVLELFEQDSQSAKLLDMALPPDASSAVASAVVLRGMWLDVIGRRDAAIEWWLNNHQWPGSVRESTAGLLLEMALERHHDSAIDIATRELRAVTSDLAAYRGSVAKLIERGLLAQAETLLGEIKVLLPPNEQPMAVNVHFLKSPRFDAKLAMRWEQTDLLFNLLQKYSKADDKEAAFRITRRLIGGADYASDDELREHLPNLVQRLKQAFKNSAQLTEFLELESQRLNGTSSPRQTLCVLRLVSEAGNSELAQSIVDQLTTTKMTALQYLEVARCQWKVGHKEEAAQFYTRAFELEPDWLESSIGNFSERSQDVEMLAKELNGSVKATTGIGKSSMEKLLNAIPNSQLPEYPQLWIGWAGNSRPKSMQHIRALLTSLRQADFDLWLKVLEQLLLTDELQPVTVAYDNGNHWYKHSTGRAIIEQQLLETRFEADQNTQFQEMLERVLANSLDHFVARLLLICNYLSVQDLARATEQLPELLRSTPRGAVKEWLLVEWRADIIRSQPNTSNTGNITNPALQAALQAAAKNQVSAGVSPMVLDRQARAKLLLHLLDSWAIATPQAASRAQIAERIIELNGMATLSTPRQVELLTYYSSHSDVARTMALFEQTLRGVGSNQTPGIPIFGESLNILAERDMDWQRHLIVVRAAQLEQKALDQSTVYVNQQRINGASERANPRALVYPPQQPKIQLIERLIAESQQQLPAVDWNPGGATFWSDCLKPQVVFDASGQTIQVVSMLETLWPVDQTISGETHDRINQSVQSWSKDLQNMGAWQVLALHDLAARLGDEVLVKQAQERLLELAKSKTWPADPKWRLACWSAVRSSSALASVASERFRLAEMARSAAAEHGPQFNQLYSLMTIAQLESYSAQALPKNKSVEKLADDVLALVKDQGRLRLRSPDAIYAHVKINLVLFDKLIKQGETELAINLLRNMRANNFIVGDSHGVLYHDPTRIRTNKLDVLETFQRLIENKIESENLQGLLEELLLRPAGHAWIADVNDNFRELNSPSPRDSTPVKWSDQFDAERTLDNPATPLNMYSQLVQLARINSSLPRLYATIAQSPNKQSAHMVCLALTALELGNVTEALQVYRQSMATRISSPFSGEDIVILRDAVFTAVRLNPLSEAALEYSAVALQGPLDGATADLLRQQFTLATKRKRPATVDNLLKLLESSKFLPPEWRDGLRVEYALNLLDDQQVKSSLMAYEKMQSEFGKRSDVPDRYMIELMNRLPSMERSQQAEIFECFLSQDADSFPWLECYALPATEPVPERFRSSRTARGLVLRALEQRQAWVSIMSWIAEYAELTAQTEAAVLAATKITVNNTAAICGAAALTARLNPELTPAALKNRLDFAAIRPSPAAMHALLDCCRPREPLHAVAVEIIVNLGFPAIALASPARAVEPPGWKHWLVMHEQTLASSTDTRPRWSLAKNGQWTAQTSTDKWYLMLRYPIEGDFQLSLIAQQMSGSKFGIGVGGLAAAQHESEPVVRSLGIGQRRSQDLTPLEILDAPDVRLKVERRGTTWQLQAAAASFEESADDSIPFVYLMNQGPGSARMDNWQLSSDLKIAQYVNLLDSQMRLWRTTLGAWKLPALKPKSGELDQTTSGVHVTDGILVLPTRTPESESSVIGTGAIHCLRPLESEETVSYEFYSAADAGPVHPVLGRMVFRLDGQQVKLQWLTRADEKYWLGMSNDQLFSLEANEVREDVKIKLDAWNQVEIKRADNNRISVQLNGQAVAQVSLPLHLAPEFGLSVSAVQPAKVRNIKLSGPWPKTLSLEELMLPIRK